MELLDGGELGKVAGFHPGGQAPNELFGVPVRNTIHPVNNAVRSKCRDRLQQLGWATKYPGRSAKYTLHREL